MELESRLRQMRLFPSSLSQKFPASFATGSGVALRGVGQMRERFALVTYEIRRRLGRHAGPNSGGLGFGYLVETPDGRAWCFPSVETVGKFPDEGDAFEINRQQLKRQPETDDGRRCFVYSWDA